MPSPTLGSVIRDMLELDDWAEARPRRGNWARMRKREREDLMVNVAPFSYPPPERLRSFIECAEWTPERFEELRFKVISGTAASAESAGME